MDRIEILVSKAINSSHGFYNGGNVVNTIVAFISLIIFASFLQAMRSGIKCCRMSSISGQIGPSALELPPLVRQSLKLGYLRV